jgi:hypothetical protein
MYAINFTLIAQNLTDYEAIDENRAAYQPKLQKGINISTRSGMEFYS